MADDFSQPQSWKTSPFLANVDGRNVGLMISALADSREDAGGQRSRRSAPVKFLSPRRMGSLAASGERRRWREIAGAADLQRGTELPASKRKRSGGILWELSELFTASGFAY